MLVLPACPFPNLYYLHAMLQASAQNETVVIDTGEHYRKQSLRNRFEVLGANGRLSISVHVVGQKGAKIPLNQLSIVDDEWRRLAWKGVCSAYGSAPFFIHYEDDLAAFFGQKWPDIAAFNLATTDWLIDALSLPIAYEVSETYVESHDKMTDLRDAFKRTQDYTTADYPQVFGDRFAFEPNLSGLDLLMNLGPAGYSILADASAR
jgi:hypothetical protein